MSAKLFREILAENGLSTGTAKNFEYQVVLYKLSEDRYGNHRLSGVYAYTDDRELAQKVYHEYNCRTVPTRNLYVAVGQRRPGTKKFGELK